MGFSASGDPDYTGGTYAYKHSESGLMLPSSPFRRLPAFSLLAKVLSYHHPAGCLPSSLPAAELPASPTEIDDYSEPLSHLSHGDPPFLQWTSLKRSDGETRHGMNCHGARVDDVATVESGDEGAGGGVTYCVPAGSSEPLNPSTREMRGKEKGLSLPSPWTK